MIWRRLRWLLAIAAITGTVTLIISRRRQGPSRPASIGTRSRGVVSWLRDRLRYVNKYVLNRVTIFIARSTGGSYPSIVHHVGRRSGKRYATPVIDELTDSGFIIPLPYGQDVDWRRNVLAAGTFEIERGGDRVAVERPETLEIRHVRAELGGITWWLWRTSGIKHVIRVKATPRQSPDHAKKA